MNRKFSKLGQMVKAIRNNIQSHTENNKQTSKGAQRWF